MKTHASSESLIVLMGSKSDLERKTDMEMVKNLTETLGVKAYEVSAKTGEGVMEAFEGVCRDLIRLNAAQMKGKESRKRLYEEQEKERKERCCS